jgi:hypothetical protein
MYTGYLGYRVIAQQWTSFDPSPVIDAINIAFNEVPDDTFYYAVGAVNIDRNCANAVPKLHLAIDRRRHAPPEDEADDAYESDDAYCQSPTVVRMDMGDWFVWYCVAEHFEVLSDDDYQSVLRQPAIPHSEQPVMDSVVMLLRDTVRFLHDPDQVNKSRDHQAYKRERVDRLLTQLTQAIRIYDVTAVLPPTSSPTRRSRAIQVPDE